MKAVTWHTAYIIIIIIIIIIITDLYSAFRSEDTTGEGQSGVGLADGGTKGQLPPAIPL